MTAAARSQPSTTAMPPPPPSFLAPFGHHHSASETSSARFGRGFVTFRGQIPQCAPKLAEVENGLAVVGPSVCPFTARRRALLCFPTKKGARSPTRSVVRVRSQFSAVHQLMRHCGGLQLSAVLILREKGVRLSLRGGSSASWRK